MRNTKTIYVLITCAVLSISVIACGSNQVNKDNSNVESATSTNIVAFAGIANSVDITPTLEPVVTSIPEPTQTATPVPTVTTATPVPTTEIPYASFTKEYTTENYGLGTSQWDTDGQDMTTKYSFRTEADTYYYVGRNDASATNFSKNNEHDAVLYLGKSMLLTTAMDKDVYYVAVSDETVAKIDGDELVPLKQGTFILTTFDKNGNKLKDIKYVVTTYNDSKTPEEIMTEVTFPITEEDLDCNKIGFIKELDYWETHCSTLMDVSLYFQGRQFYYTFEGEPEINALRGSNNPLDKWTWNNSIECIFENNKGVCLQAAQMAVYLLANDFEDWGVFMIDGKYGHIFNWFYEDGNYYVFDYTTIISYNAWQRVDGAYRDFSSNVMHFTTYEDMCKWVVESGKVDTEANYAIYEYSLQGYNDLPANINTGNMTYGCDAILNGEATSTIGYQDIIMKDLNPIYIKDGCKVEFISFTLDEIPSKIPHGVIGRTETYNYYFDYQGQ